MKKKKAVLYLYVDKSTKDWLRTQARKQVGNVSQSTLAERILTAAKKYPQLLGAS